MLAVNNGGQDIKSLVEAIGSESKAKLECAEGLSLDNEDGIRDPLWSRGLGDVYKRQFLNRLEKFEHRIHLSTSCGLKLLSLLAPTESMS